MKTMIYYINILLSKVRIFIFCCTVEGDCGTRVYFDLHEFVDSCGFTIADGLHPLLPFVRHI